MHFDLDVGGYDRAKYRFTGQDIASKSYPIPNQLDVDDIATAKTVSIRQKKLKGYKECWFEFAKDYSAALKDEKVKTVVVDSATQLWEVVRQATLQEKQEAQDPLRTGDKYREALLPVEYAEANNRMRAVIHAARSYQKHLVLVHYPRDVYAQKLTERGVQEVKTGEVEIDGFKYTQALVDLVVRTYADNTKDGINLYSIVTLSGVALELTGRKIDEMTYAKLSEAIEMVRGAKL